MKLWSAWSISVAAVGLVSLGLPTGLGGGTEGNAGYELFLVGPFRLGDAFKEMSETDRMIGSPTLISKGGGPKATEIIQSLNKCKLHVIQARKRVNAKPGEWDFANPPEVPDAVVEGMASYDLKGSKGKPFNIHVRQVTMFSQDYCEAKGKSPRLCRVYLEIKLSTSKYGADADGLNFSFGPIFWDVKGKLWKEPQE